MYLLQLRSTNTSSPTPLEGWQFDDNSRSSWDILWSCLSVIFACTWTALHLNIPKNDPSVGKIFSKKVIYWLLCVIYPELLLVNPAAEDFLLAKEAFAHFKSAQAEIDQGRELTAPSSTLLSSSEAGKSSPTRVKWTLTHGFCVNMRGLALRTTDNRTYIVELKYIKTLVKAGIIKYDQFDIRDIDDRSKTDSLAKVVSLIQSAWTTVNVLARAAYKLPITPLEIATLAFIFCAFISYGLWWQKPKDMNAPIVIYLPYNHDSNKMAPELQYLLTEDREGWIKYKAQPGETEPWVLWKLLVKLCKSPIQMWRTFKDVEKLQPQEAHPSPENMPSYQIASLHRELLGNLGIFLASLAFSAIHIAA